VHSLRTKEAAQSSSSQSKSLLASLRMFCLNVNCIMNKRTSRNRKFTATVSDAGEGDPG